MMKLVVLLFAVLGLAAAFTETEYQQAFLDWTHEHNRIYDASEFQLRFQNFRNNMDYVRNWNANNNMTILGLNVMADLSNEEYQKIYLGTRNQPTTVFARTASTFVPTGPLADTVDWRTKGAVTPVKDQGQCGSCWAFSTTGSVEGAVFLKTGTLPNLSEQELVDCSSAYGNMGCNGGLMDNAFRYIIAKKGLNTEASYPYTARNGQCKSNPANIGATITSYKDVPSQQEAALMQAVNNQPVSVAIDASHPSFQLYKTGVYYEARCSSTRLDHGVLAVGYGSDGTSDYWIVKNSWGVNWGMNGFINMARNKQNNCGIATISSYPVA